MFPDLTLTLTFRPMHATIPDHLNLFGIINLTKRDEHYSLPGYTINPFQSYVGPSDIMIFLFSTLFLIFNPFQSNISATCILPSSYLFWAGKRLVGYL
jgi:hypothetical protein